MFDLDGTLAESKQPLSPRMAGLLSRLLKETRVAIVSGGALLQFLKQVVEQLPPDTAFENLYLMPTSGAALYEYSGGDWKNVYRETLSDGEMTLIEAAIRRGVRETGVVSLDAPSAGPRIEKRGSEVTFSALGQQADIAAKKAWDPDHKKRHALQQIIAEELPGYEVAMGGSTSIDITKRGVDKAFGIRKIAEHLSIPIKEMVYVGDELREDGNDAAAFETGIATHAVEAVADTEKYIESLLD